MILQQNNNKIIYFRLSPNILPKGHILALDFSLCTLAHLEVVEDLPLILTQIQFSPAVFALLLPLLYLYPNTCTYDILLAEYRHQGYANEELIQLVQQELQAVNNTIIWDQILRPLRNVLSRTRIKLNAMGFTIRTVIETGCVLDKLK